MGIGKAVKKIDGRQKVTGTAKFVEDLIPPDALYAKVLHSTVASGAVKSIDCAEALRVPGVRGIITCFDAPATAYATAGHPLSLDPGHGDIKDRLILSRYPRFYGDEIGAVAAVDPLAALKAVERIKVEYETYTPMLTPAEAVGGARAINPAYPTNELGRLDFSIEGSDTRWGEARFSADPRIEGLPDLPASRFYVPAVHAAHIETNACFAYMDGSKMVIVTCNQVPFTARRNIAQALQMPLGLIRVIKPYLGGGFGNKQDTLYEPIAALLSQKLGGKCVALIMTREETFVCSRTRHAMDIYAAMEVDRDGRMRKRAVRVNANGGAYAAHGHAVTAYAVTNYFQTYTATGEQVGESSTAYTNLPSAAALRGYGIPQLAFALESHVDDTAAALGMDPVAFRGLNIMRDGFLDPFDHFVAENCGLAACLDKGAQAVDWERRRAAYAKFNATSPKLKKGLGMAVFSYKTGVYPLQIENAACRVILNEDGTAQIQVGATDLGQGSDTIFAQIASEILTIPEDRLFVMPVQDTDITPYDAGSYASRQTYVSGGAVKKAALLMKAKLLERAAAMLGRQAGELTLVGEGIASLEGGDPLASIAEVAAYTQYCNDHVTQTEHLTAEATYTCMGNAFAFGACFAAVEVDVPLGKVRIKRIVNVHDSGTLLNPQLAQGQVHGGIAMGVGYALSEQLLYDKKTGRMLNNNFLDYKIPTCMDIPPMEVHFVESYEPTGPFGNKALGEPPLIPLAPAIRNAVLHATGVAVNALPLSPQNLIEAFIEAGLIDEAD
ncbi:MAG: molybdopterin-dependent oxidoreductase [Peptococcaceae bacterium]|jgi:xanthine dehydrogenase molybdenum-binding subunit|nr:molybdopterin-dependent oxidoreductase [Peptococcaceae bacterium]